MCVRVVMSKKPYYMTNIAMGCIMHVHGDIAIVETLDFCLAYLHAIREAAQGAYIWNETSFCTHVILAT